MKRIMILILVFLGGKTFACNDHLYRLALNQRSFYNPAALCPYCVGSFFISGGLSWSPDVVGNGQMYAFGNDGKNRIHGPADIAFSSSSGHSVRMESYSARYAWAQDLGGGWRASIGLRASYAKTVMQFMHEGTVQRSEISFADLDAGIFITNSQGIYAGFSAQHIPSHDKQLLTGENNSVLTRETEMGVNAGGVIPVCPLFDVMADASFVKAGMENSTQLNSMIRFFSVLGIGGGVTFFSDRKPETELRGGITTTGFKLLGSMAFTAQGKMIEIGTVIRFGADKHHRWIIYPIRTQCTGGTCTPPHKRRKKNGDEFNPHA